ncbi:MAG: Gfo/Idh/MocA family oxidoreductase [Thermoflexibacter sp.]
MVNKDKKNEKGMSRRQFVTGLGASVALFSIVPRHVLGKGYIPPSDKLNVAGVGVGGRGRPVLQGIYNGGTENIVALCDVDDARAEATYKDYPNAKRYKDFRKMLEAEKNNIDAVMVATPDHTHAVIAMAAMQLGKHVYVEKPLTHNIYEARMLTEMARKNKIVTQMGNQGSSGEGVRQMTEWIQAGVIGDVTNVHAWTNRPIWPQGLPTPTEKVPVPKTLDWELWLGPANFRDYNPIYVPFGWRGWWDFGTGALGDMACHIIDPVFRALKLGYPISVEASVTGVWTNGFKPANVTDSCPSSSNIHLEFPAREGMPAVKLHWYDGGIKPPRPEELKDDEPMGDWNGGVIFEGKRGKIMCGCYGANPTLLPTSEMAYFNAEKLKSLPRIEGNDRGHQTSWVAACKGGAPASSNFDYAGPLTETVLMGNLTLRSLALTWDKDGKKISGDKKLLWDGQNMRITNFEPANQFVKREYRNGWSLGV